MSNGCLHSKSLNDVFDISPVGVDFKNDFGVRFEFKESFMINEKNIFFKVPWYQVKNSDFFIFCVANFEYYLVDKIEILGRFSFKTKEKHACIRISTIRNIFLEAFIDVNDLKVFIENIENC